MTEKTKRCAIYWILAVSLLLLLATYGPYLINYYVIQPDMSVFAFYAANPADEFYEFEGVVIALFVVAVWCFFRRVGIGVLAACIPLTVLSYASATKYASRNELFRLSDLRLTEAAGMAVHYLDFHFNPAQLKVIGAMVFFCVCGLAFDHMHKKLLEPARNRKEMTVLRVLSGLCCLLAAMLYAHGFISARSTIEAVDDRNVADTRTDRYILYSFLKNDSLAGVNMAHVDESYAFSLGGQKRARRIRRQRRKRTVRTSLSL